MAKQVLIMSILIYCSMHISMVIGGSIFNDFTKIAIHINPTLAAEKNDELAIEREPSTLDCSKFRRDYDILKSFSFPVQISPQITTEKTFALMNTNNEVIELTIHKEKYVPMNLYCLKNLNVLTINNTRFHEFFNDDLEDRGIPAEIGQLTLLTELYIYDSPVLSIPKEIANLNALNILIIESGVLKQLTNAIDKLSTLTYLKLSKNKLKTLPSTFGNLNSLQTLFLDNNELTSLPSTFGNLYSLETLFLVNNELTSLPSTMSTLSSLRTLDLQSNPLTSIDELNNLKLNVLDAQNCKIEYLPTNLPYLYNLNMSSNNLEDLFGIGTLGRVSSRDKNFDFSHNRIEIVPPEISLIISWIQTFSVKNNHLSHLPKEFFGLYDGDKTQIDLSQNWFSDDELNLIKTTMQTKLPHVQVVY